MSCGSAAERVFAVASRNEGGMWCLARSTGCLASSTECLRLTRTRDGFVLDLEYQREELTAAPHRAPILTGKTSKHITPDSLTRFLTATIMALARDAAQRSNSLEPGAGYFAVLVGLVRQAMMRFLHQPRYCSFHEGMRVSVAVEAVPGACATDPRQRHRGREAAVVRLICQLRCAICLRCTGLNCSCHGVNDLEFVSHRRSS